MRYLVSILVLSAALGMALVGSGTASGSTVHFVSTFSRPHTNPCTGESGTLTRTLRFVFYGTETPSGNELNGFVATGEATFVPDDPAQPALTGTYHSSFHGSATANTQVFPFTQTLRLGGDGSRVVFHEVGQVVLGPNGPAAEFDRIQLSCA